ncbi:type II toxin-antitoxin system death-on-curing family toxin [Candidatus Woesebacteria bacterium]|nr:type II toxin-antitoxin system death-on-curing family toxin [Candidatus Woesebacteria bacterium]
MDDLEFLLIEEVVIIHEKMIEVGGGSSGIRDIELLHSAIERAKATFGGKYLYNSIFDMAAALLQSLVKNHPFIDGNKRTAFFSMLRFLQKNSLELNVDNDEIVDFMVKVDTENLSIAAISKWVEVRLAR